MILYFSGTGNTRKVAHQLAAVLGDEVAAMDVSAVEPKLNGLTDRVVWCFPVYAWGLPKVVENYIRKLEWTEASQATHFMVATCGDDTGYTDRQWHSLIDSRGWKVVGAFAVQMPNTYVFLPGFDVDSKAVEDSKLMAADATIEKIAAAICRGEGGEVLRGSFPGLKSGLLRAWFLHYKMTPKPFKPNGGCTGCGFCSRICPMGNIEIVDGRPKWKDNCAMCLRCYHACPRHAVSYGKSSEGKGQYLNPNFNPAQTNN